MRLTSRLIALTGAALLLMTGAGLCADVAKIGVVEFQRLLQHSDAGKDAKAELTAKGKAMETEFKEKQTELEELKHRLEREALVMSKEMREEKEREFRIKVNAIKILQKKYQDELQGIEKELLGKIQSETLDIIDEIGKSGGYLMIMDKRGVLYSPSTIDITDEVIKRYNDRYAKTKKKG